MKSLFEMNEKEKLEKEFQAQIEVSLALTREAIFERFRPFLETKGRT